LGTKQEAYTREQSRRHLQGNKAGSIQWNIPGIVNRPAQRQVNTGFKYIGQVQVIGQWGIQLRAGHTITKAGKHTKTGSEGNAGH